jgi:hypothetical protein
LVESRSPFRGRNIAVLITRFEKELEKLRKEMELASATGSLSGPSTNGSPYTEPASPNDGSHGGGIESSPLVLPGTSQNNIPELVLDKPDSAERSDTLKVKNA